MDQAAPPYQTLLEEALDAWRYTREGVIAELENLPPERWDFSPAPEARSITELARHVLQSGRMMAGELTRPDGDFTRKSYPEFIAEYAAADTRVDDAGELIGRLKEAWQEADRRIRTVGELFMLQTIRRFDGLPGTRLAWLQHGIEHESYHRGQIALYARLIGHVPALTQRIRGGS